MTAWLPSSSHDQPDACRLYCLPHAGGGSALYHRWERLLSPEIVVQPIKLPGRESRIREQAIDSMPTMIEQLMDHVAPSMKPPFALFGHSMGGLVAYEFARRLVERALPPAALFVSGARAPHLVRPEQPLHTLPEDEMLDRLLDQYGAAAGTSPEERQMMKWMAGTIRADLRLLETYQYTASAPLACPVTALVGSEDRQVTLAHASGWRQHTSARFAIRTLPGHHFFLREQESAITKLISGRLSGLADGTP